MKRRSIFPFLIYLAILVFVIWMLFSIFGRLGNSVAYSEVLELFEKEQVSSFVVEDGKIHLWLREPYEGSDTIVTEIADPELFRQETAGTPYF